MTPAKDSPSDRPRWVRVIASSGAVIRVDVDGVPYEARAGDSVLSAILGVVAHFRLPDLAGRPRAGFCLMGACQECWVWLGDARRVRACGTLVADGMKIRTTWPAGEAPDG